VTGNHVKLFELVSTAGLAVFWFDMHVVLTCMIGLTRLSRTDVAIC
jgi:hypothetical protein